MFDLNNHYQSILKEIAAEVKKPDVKESKIK